MLKCAFVILLWLPNASFAQENEGFLARADRQFHEDADVVQMENLLHWSELIEKYHAETGHYPLADLIVNGDFALSVRIATRGQQRYFAPDNRHYRRELDFNRDGRLKELPVLDLIAELAKYSPVIERYGIQKVPTDAPVWLHYVAVDDGYILWAVCDSCEPTPYTVEFDLNGLLQTVNVAGGSVLPENEGFFTRANLSESPEFQALLNRPLHKDFYVRKLVAAQARHWQDR